MAPAKHLTFQFLFHYDKVTYGDSITLTMNMIFKSIGSWYPVWAYVTYRKASNISRALVDNKIVHNSDVVGASPVGAPPTISSFST